jgi:hypothetical protein
MNDALFRVLLIAKIVWKLKARIIDVEMAFLHGRKRSSSKFHL